MKVFDMGKNVKSPDHRSLMLDHQLFAAAKKFFGQGEIDVDRRIAAIEINHMLPGKQRYVLKSVGLEFMEVI